MHQQMIDVGDVKLNVVSTGKANDPRRPVILLHGFPEFSYSWRHQLKFLDEKGFHAVAPDLRGYNLSDKPSGVSAYRFEKLAGDVVGLMRALGHEQADVVGHDWGGAVAWYLAMTQPARVRKLVTLNCPHPRLFAQHVRSFAQLKKSWYMFFFQLPFLPERMILREDFAKRVLRGTATQKQAFSDEDLEKYKAAHRQPGAATAMLNYYRAMMRRIDPRGLSRRLVEVPTLAIWGEQDRALGTSLLDGLPELVPDLRVHRVANAGHWVQQEAPDEVNQQLLEFLR